MARTRRSVTMIDVAHEAGVSVATVSNVLKETGRVAQPTRERVLATVERLGYRRNEIARALKENTSRMLGVVTPNAVNPYFPTLTIEVERRARRDGFGVLVAETNNDPEIEAAQVRSLAERQVDGVIFAALTRGSEIPAELLDRGIPVVYVSFTGADQRLGIVDTDEFGAMEAVAEHLVALGHSRVAYAYSGEHEESIERRPLALSTALEKRGISMLSVDDSPTAICCASDAVAVDLLDRLIREGNRVPDSISVVGYDDIPLAAHISIDLTTVHQELEVMARTATEMLLAAIAEERLVAERLVLPARLVVRGSTGPAPDGRRRATSAPKRRAREATR